jgi:hypothetical protein
LGEKKDLIAAGDSAMIFFKTPMQKSQGSIL